MDTSNENDEHLMEEKERTKRSPRKLGIGLINFVLALCIAIALSTGTRVVLWKTGIMSSMIDELTFAPSPGLTQEQLEQYDESLKLYAKLMAENVDESGRERYFYLTAAASCLIMILCGRRINWYDLPIAVTILTSLIALVGCLKLQHDMALKSLTLSGVLESFFDGVLLGWYAALPADDSLNYLVTSVALPARASIAYSAAYDIAEIRAWFWRGIVPGIGGVLTSLPWWCRKWKDHRAKLI